MQQVLILGGGFAGFWAAANAARVRSQHGLTAGDVSITVVDRNPFHDIRVRNYEQEPSPTIPLADLLAPIGVGYLQATVTGIDVGNRRVAVAAADGTRTLAYDALVHALGSQVFAPDIPGLREHAFNVDTHAGAERLQAHLASLPRSTRPERYTAVVVGAGLAGIEATCELPGRLARIRATAQDDAPVRVLLVDHAAHIGSNMGAEACAVIDAALQDLHVETRTGVTITAITDHGLILDNGERIDAETVIWCAGMRSNPLGRAFGLPLDRFGRIPVDACMRVQGLDRVFAAGDTASFEISAGHQNVMSCQHGITMGCHAGNNVMAQIVGDPLLPLHYDTYVTYLDLGPWGAVCTNGWDRHVVAVREEAKKIKLRTTYQSIVPPPERTRDAILAASSAKIHTLPGLAAIAWTGDGHPARAAALA